jgi:hypothetical protein
MHGGRKRALKRGVVQVWASPKLSVRIQANTRSGKDPLPGPADIALRNRSRQRAREGCAANARPKVAVELLPHSSKVPSQFGEEAHRQWDSPILVALSAANHDLATVEVDVPDSQRQAFIDAQATSVKQRGAQTRDTSEAGEHPADLRLRQHDRQPSAIVATGDATNVGDRLSKNVPIQEEDGAERLILRRRAHSTVHRKVLEEAGYVTLTQLRRVAPVMKYDKATYPIDVRRLRALAVATRSQPPTNAFEQPQLSLRVRRPIEVRSRYLGVVV